MEPNVASDLALNDFALAEARFSEKCPSKDSPSEDCPSQNCPSLPQRVFIPAEGVIPIPAEEFTPRPLLMGRAGSLAGPKEEILPYYFALEETRVKGLLTTPSHKCGTAVIALYGSVEDVVMARKDWFRKRFSEVLCVEMFAEAVAGVRTLTRDQAMVIRRGEADARGEDPSLIPTVSDEGPMQEASRQREAPPRQGDSFLGALASISLWGWLKIAGGATLLFFGLRALMLLAG